MKIRMLVIASLVALAGLVAVPTAPAQVSVGIGIRIGPPPLRHEVMVPRPYAHAVWMRGHWIWNRHQDRYVWMSGRWVAARPGFFWTDGRWTHEGRGWMWKDGFWREQESRNHHDHERHERERRDMGHRR